MTLIDQRILIDAPPQVVWDYISDPAKLTSWNAGYTNVSVLTTQQTGPGTRRRCTPANGKKDVIEEITHWVDGWGYEYTIVDGGPYRHYQGRLRLQAVPDGTSVQWIVSYRPKGPLGLLRDRLNGRRAVMVMMATSLRQLRRRIDELGVRMDADTRARVGMQGRLNADERAHYQRRYAPPPGLETPEGALAGEPAADQPVPAPPDAPAEIPTGPVPSFVAGLTSGLDEPDYASTADTEPRAPKGLREAIQAQQDSAPLPDAAAQDIAPPEGAPSISASQEAPPQDSAPQEVPPPPTITPPVERAPLAKPPAEEETRSPFAPPIAPPVAPPAAPPAESAVPDILPDYRRPAPPAEPAAPDVLPDYRRPTPPRGIPSVKRTADDSPPPEETSEPPRAVPAPPVAPPAAPVLPADSRPDMPSRVAESPATPARAMPPVEPSPLRTAQEMPPARRPDLPPPTPTTDTGEMSIWEVFGMTRPSEQDTAALNDLIHSVETRKKKDARRARRGGAKRPVRVRQMPAAVGLRLRLQMVRVRWEHKAR